MSDEKRVRLLGIIAIVAVGAIIVALISQEESVIVVTSEIQEGQIIDLAYLPQNMILPNGAELKKISMQTLAGVEIISAEYISSEAYPPIKLTWLDSNGKGVAYSSHTVLNKPLYYGFHDGDSGVIGIWPHLGARKVKVEIWKE